MFDANIVITPYDSSAVQRLEWDSEHEALVVTYNDGGEYHYQEIGYTDFIDLAKKAHDTGSWGKGLFRWKQARTREFERVAREQFQVFMTNLNNMHPKDKERWQKWVKAELAKTTF